MKFILEKFKKNLKPDSNFESQKREEEKNKYEDNCKYLAKEFSEKMKGKLLYKKIPLEEPIGVYSVSYIDKNSLFAENKITFYDIYDKKFSMSVDINGVASTNFLFDKTFENPEEAFNILLDMMHKTVSYADCSEFDKNKMLDSFLKLLKKTIIKKDNI